MPVRPTVPEVYGGLFEALIIPTAGLAITGAIGFATGFLVATLVAIVVGIWFEVWLFKKVWPHAQSPGVVFCVPWPWVAFGMFWLASQWQTFCIDECTVPEDNNRTVVGLLFSLTLLPPAALWLASRYRPRR